MRPFTYLRPGTVQEAVTAYAGNPDARFLGGGTNLVDLMKNGVERPNQLIDLRQLPMNKVEESGNGIRIGALVPNSDLAAHPLIRQRFPLVSQALLAGASSQLRNAATTGGNLLQRTRCYYFMDPTFTQCNKRQPGSGCAARDGGVQRIHAILGASAQCVATHPSDLCVALSAHDAIVHVTGPKGERTINFVDFHRLPGNTPQRDTNLEHGDLITAIELPMVSSSTHAHYLKVRDRQSYAFALVSAAVALDVQGQTIRTARIALGGVAHKPWRATDAERALAGKPANEQSYRAAAETVVRAAQPLPGNRFKVELARNTIVRALMIAAGETA